MIDWNEYQLKRRGCKALKLDREWLKFVNEEAGFPSANLGDYLYLDANGNRQIMPAENFERLFEPL